MTEPDMQSMEIRYGTAQVIVTTLCHPAAELADGADDQYLAMSVELFARARDLPGRWQLIGERRSPDGWEQYWLAFAEDGRG